MDPLPIDPDLPAIIDAIRRANAAVIVAPPGAGKTTRVPVAMLRGGIIQGEHRNIIMLQPRRVAARAAAARIAAENHWQLGGEVGYHVRFDRKIGKDTRLRVLTEGILTRQLLDDPFLEGVGAVILDEFHERSLNTDLAIALLREVQQTVREDLKIVVMSATLDAAPVARFLGNCPIVTTQGRTYPIDISYEPCVRGDEEDAVIRAVESVTSREDILIFLPGAEEIRRVLRGLESIGGDVALHALHGSLTGDEQDAAIRPDPAGRRKIIAATNIAETSLTIEGVGVVIDTGLARVAGYDPQRGLDKLEVKRISRASAAQRAGRAGRTGPGRCIRLWSEKEWERMADFELPEIKRVDLCSTVLELHAWGRPDVRNFGWYDSPDGAMLESAESLAAMLGAIDSAGKITAIGKQLASLPVHPRLGRLLVEAAGQNLLREGALLAALMSEKDIIRGGPMQSRDSLAAGAGRMTGSSDLLMRMHLLESNPRDDRLDRQGVKQVIRVRDELMRMRVQGSGFGVQDSEEALLRMVLLAYPDRVCRRRGNADRAVMVGGGGVKLSPESVLRQGEFFIAVDARHDDRSQSREAFVRIASRIERHWLEEMFPDQIRREQAVRYDDDRQRVVAMTRIFYRDLLLHEDKDAPVDPARSRDLFAEVIRDRAPEIFRGHEDAQTVIHRVTLLREKMPEHPWPAGDDAQLGEILADSLGGAATLTQVKNLQLAGILKSSLQYPLDRLLDAEAPETLLVPSGNHIRLRYSGGEVVLAVRLQELFGMHDTPRIAGGRVPVKLELLAPNFRPVQITTDLRSFWTNTYAQVKKDLKARYPKHSWPDDPWTAKAEAKGARRNR